MHFLHGFFLFFFLLIPNGIAASPVPFKPKDCLALFNQLNSRVFFDFRLNPRFRSLTFPQQNEVTAVAAYHGIIKKQHLRVRRERIFFDRWMGRYQTLREFYFRLAPTDWGSKASREWADRLAVNEWQIELRRSQRRSQERMLDQAYSPFQLYFPSTNNISLSSLEALRNLNAVMNAIQINQLFFLSDLVSYSLYGMDISPAIVTAANTAIGEHFFTDRHGTPEYHESILEGFLPGRHIIYLPDGLAFETIQRIRYLLRDERLGEELRGFLQAQHNYFETFGLPPTNAHRDLVSLIEADWLTRPESQSSSQP